jgi:NAD(P)-dependent dehydrogenase (short-subunit alcohol dehydrogenase family)
VVSLSGKVAVVTGAGAGMGRAIAPRLAALGAAVVEADADAVAAAVDRAVTTHGGLDVLVAIAAAAPDPTPFEELPEQEFQQMLAVNVLGPWLGARAAAPALRERGGGSIVLVGDTVGERPRPGLTAHGAAMAAAHHLAKALALELAGDRIRVNCVAPRANVATPDDIAEAVVHFACDDGAFLTGVVLPLDGGRG